MMTSRSRRAVASASAVAASMPLNFLGNKLWSFRRESGRLAVAAR